MGHRVLRSVLLIVFIGAASAPAPPPDLNQLKDKLQQFEQMMLDLKSQIAAGEQQQASKQPLMASNPGANYHISHYPMGEMVQPTTSILFGWERFYGSLLGKNDLYWIARRIQPRAAYSEELSEGITYAC